MLKKLLRYDLKNVYKILVIFYALALFFALLTRIFLGIENSFIMNIIGKVCSGVTISMLFNILVNNLMRMWVRFKANLYSDEAYLTHTLPITKTQLYISKTLCAVITLLISVAVMGITLFIAYYSKENIEFLKSLLLPVADAYNTSMTALLIALLFVFFLQFVNILQCGLIGVVLGHKMNNSKVGYSIMFGFISYIITQIFTVLVIFGFALFNKGFMNLFVTNEVVSVNVIKTIMLLAIIIYSFVIVVGYFINLKLFKKGVNID